MDFLSTGAISLKIVKKSKYEEPLSGLQIQYDCYRVSEDRYFESQRITTVHDTKSLIQSYKNIKSKLKSENIKFVNTFSKMV